MGFIFTMLLTLTTNFYVVVPTTYEVPLPTNVYIEEWLTAEMGQPIRLWPPMVIIRADLDGADYEASIRSLDQVERPAIVSILQATHHEGFYAWDGLGWGTSTGYLIHEWLHSLGIPHQPDGIMRADAPLWEWPYLHLSEYEKCKIREHAFKRWGLQSILNGCRNWEAIR